MTQSSTSYNGWSNWDTWEAFNLLTSDEEIYKIARFSGSNKTLTDLIFESLSKAGLDGFDAVNHINVSKVNFTEIKDALE